MLLTQIEQINSHIASFDYQSASNLRVPNFPRRLFPPSPYARKERIFFGRTLAFILCWIGLYSVCPRAQFLSEPRILRVLTIVGVNVIYRRPSEK
jgi:hypothetical protein